MIHQISSSQSSEVAYYRFYKNKRVKIADLISHLVAPTASRVRGRHVLILGDSTEISLKAQLAHIRDQERVGVLSDNKTPGFHMHVSMCLDAESGHGLGLSDLMVWNRAPAQGSKQARDRARRSRPWSEKESYKWALGIEKSLEVLSDASCQTFIFDAESDTLDVWQGLQKWPAEAIIRLNHNRKVIGHQASETGMKIREYLAAQAPAGQYSFALRELKRRNYSRNQAQKRQARQAQMEVRFAQVELDGFPQHQRPYYLVHAQELPQSVPEGEDPLDWLLLTTHPIGTFEQAYQIIQWYGQRWMIEQLFRISKRKGFAIEETELEYLDSILKQSLTTIKASFEVMQLLLARDQMEGQPIETVFEPQQIQCLKALDRKYQGRTAKQQNPYPPDQLSWATWILARMGGWKGIPSRRPPGPIILFRGLKRFNMTFEGWRLLTNEGDVTEP